MDETVQADATGNSVYATFAGGIDQNAVQRFMGSVAGVSASKISCIHVLFQSFGGNVSDGICLYNFFRTLPINLTFYNVGNVSSAAAIAFLGAHVRKVAANATFMIHRAQSPGNPATAVRLQAVAHSIAIDDTNIETILRAHLVLSEDQWAVHNSADLWLSAKEAVACGLADIGEFAPPKGAQIFNI